MNDQNAITPAISGKPMNQNSAAIPKIMKNELYRMTQILRVNAGGGSCTDRPCRFPVLVRELMLYGAISLIASFTLRCRFTWSQSIRSTLSCPDSGLSLSRCATLLRRRIGRSIGKRFDWSVARHYNDAVSSSHPKHKPAPRSRQAPLSCGVLSL